MKDIERLLKAIKDLVENAAGPYGDYEVPPEYIKELCDAYEEFTGESLENKETL